MPSYNEGLQAKRRLVALSVTSLVIIGGIGLRLFQLQIADHAHYEVLAKSSQSHKYEVTAKRGEIFALDGDTTTPLVLNQTLDTLYADPRFVNNKAKVAGLLAKATGGSATDYEKQLQAKGDYVVLARKLPEEVSAQIKKLNLAGIGLQEQSYRLYPEGTLASQLLGFVNSEGKGQYGLEGYLNKRLAGTAGLLSATTDINGIPIATAKNLLKPPKNGDSYVLTIDRNIQSQAEKYLEDGVKAVGAPSGSVLVMDPETGAIKAMANYPTFDPAGYAKVKDYSVFSNDTVTGAFEPGSGFKVFTMAAGLDSGKVTPSTTYNDTGSYEVDGYTIKNSENRSYGPENMENVIQRSLNTGVIFVLRSMGADVSKITASGKRMFYDYLTNHFGFGLRTGIEQQGESPGRVNPPTASNVNYANMTFGQGLTVNMVQMVQGYAAIANGGTLYQPYLVAKVIHADGSTTITKPHAVRKKIISSQAAGQLYPMLEGVVERGTGQATKIPGYKIGGKTGTAQVPKPGGGYDPKKNIGSFTGFGPIGDPKFVMMVRVNEPKTGGFAESTTVPIFGQIAKWLLRYYAVPPSP